eukprot:evm.model.scf_1061.1 EVM.evm.TU.scf_1061.1   scf_1061:1209-4667(+)
MLAGYLCSHLAGSAGSGSISTRICLKWCQVWAGVVCGAVAGAAAVGGRIGLLAVWVDDPVGSSVLHGLSGAWGLLFVGLLADEDFIGEVYGSNMRGRDLQGIFYGGSGNLLAAQAIGAIAIAAWAAANFGVLFLILRTAGVLRVDSEGPANGSRGRSFAEERKSMNDAEDSSAQACLTI